MANFFDQFDPAPTSAPAKPAGGNFFDQFDAPADPRREGGALNAAARGFVDGIPVAGPYLLAGADRADAAVRSFTDGTSYDDETAKARAYGDQMKVQHPYASTAGEVVGGIAGTAPLVAAAPAAFGISAAALPARMALSTVSSGILGGADSAVRSGGDVDAAGRGALTGAALGAAAPVLGAAVGAGVRRVGDAFAARATPTAGYGPAAIGKLAEDTAASGGSGAVRVRLGELGPDAMLMDASPSFSGRAQGLAIQPETRQAIVDPLERRAAGANRRIQTDVRDTLGPATDPEAFRAAQTAAYGEAIPPLYREALSQPVTVDTSNILADIGRLGATEKGGAERALQRAWDMLHTERDVPGIGRAMAPDRRPEALHNAKEALDGMIAQVQAQQGSAARSELRALTTVRSGLNDALEAQVPGYANANRNAQHFFRQNDAFEQGQTLLNGGREAARPAQVAADTAAMTPEVQNSQRLGLRAEIDRLMGTQLNDRVALRKALLGEGDYNRARMGTVFGEEPTQRLASTVDREAAFDRIHNDVVRGSQSAQRLASAQGTAPREISAGAPDALPGLAAIMGGPTAGAGALATKLGLGGVRLATSASQHQADIARNRHLAAALTQNPGTTIDELLAAIDRRSLLGRIVEGASQKARTGAQAATISQADRLRTYLPEAFVARR